MITRREFFKSGAAAATGAIAARNVIAQTSQNETIETKIGEPSAAFITTVNRQGIETNLHRLDKGDLIRNVPGNYSGGLRTFNITLVRAQAKGGEVVLAKYESATGFSSVVRALNIQNGKVSDAAAEQITRDMRSHNIVLPTNDAGTVIERLANPRQAERTLVLARKCTDPTIARDPLRLAIPSTDVSPQATCHLAFRP